MISSYSNRHKHDPNWLKTLEHVTHRLWDTVMGPVIKALPSDAKVTLIPSGLSALLPLHAAYPRSLRSMGTGSDAAVGDS